MIRELEVKSPMASSNQDSEQLASKDSRLGGELERVEKCLNEARMKNVHLEEMLLYTTEELEKEKENSQRIVQTLTERLMESREMINKLEMENIRYRKDCILAVELLQCNRSVDQGLVANTVKRLSISDSTDSVNDPIHKPGNVVTMNENSLHTSTKNKTAKDETKSVLQTRTRTLSNKNKTKSEGRKEDTTALLAEKDTNENVMDTLRQAKASVVQDNGALKEKGSLLKNLKNLKETQFQQTPERIAMVERCNAPVLSVLDKVEDKNTSVERPHNEDSLKEEAKYLNEEWSSVEKRPIANGQSEDMDSQVDEKLVETDHEISNNEASCPKNETDEWSEDKPLIIYQTESSTEGLKIAKANENVKSRGETSLEGNAFPPRSKNTVRGENSDDGECTGLSSRIGGEAIDKIKTKKKDTADEEYGKLISLDEERSEEKPTQKSSSEICTAATATIASNARDKPMYPTDRNNTEASAANDDIHDDDQEKSSMDNLQSNESETNSNADKVEKTIAEIDDETLTAEENTPLV